ncbi:MAG: hypothetical protein PUD87_08580 [Prevotellaceae bacterium]|nr:hypothetical protein [Prevotellaceae bacterium]
MNYLEIESEIEARKGLAEGIRRKMADYEKSINRISKSLFGLSINGTIPRASALHLMLGAAQWVNQVVRIMEEARDLSEKCVMMPEGGFWQGNLDNTLATLHCRINVVAMLLKEQKPCKPDTTMWAECDELMQYSSLEANVGHIANIVMKWITRVRDTIGLIEDNLHDAAAKAKLLDRVMDEYKGDGGKEAFALLQDDIDSQTLVQICTLNPELRMVMLFGNDHVAMMDNLIKAGCTENQLMTVVVFIRMIKQLYGRKMKERNEVKLVSTTGEDRDNRFLYAINKVIEEGLLKYGYDWTWIELYCEGAINDVQFNAPKSFLDYLLLIGVNSLPDRTSLAKKIDVVRGEYPNWTFTDTSSSKEIKRRKLVVGRFIFHYNNFSKR